MRWSLQWPVASEVPEVLTAVALAGVVEKDSECGSRPGVVERLAILPWSSAKDVPRVSQKNTLTCVARVVGRGSVSSSFLPDLGFVQHSSVLVDSAVLAASFARRYMLVDGNPVAALQILDQLELFSQSRLVDGQAWLC